MSWGTDFLFLITVIPLIFTPGPDIMYAISQGLSGGNSGMIKAVCGLLLGYVAHAVLSAFGVAAIVSASPTLFSILKWAGVLYLSYLALQMLKSACTAKTLTDLPKSPPASLFRGFLISFLNPKGLLVYLTILPQFMTSNNSIVLQSLTLSAIFIICCAFAYIGIGMLAVKATSRKQQVSDKSRRGLEAASGGLLAIAAIKMAS